MIVSKQSADWLNIKQWLLDRIDDLHSQMEQPLGVEMYNQLRGSVLLARELIEQVEPTTPPQVSEETYGISDPNSGY